jgi:hypothetical protein
MKYAIHFTASYPFAETDEVFCHTHNILQNIFHLSHLTWTQTQSCHDNIECKLCVLLNSTQYNTTVW